MPEQYVQDQQDKAIQRCNDPTPIPAEDARKTLALLLKDPSRPGVGITNIVIARLALESNERLLESNEKYSRRLIWLTWALVFLTVVLIAEGLVPFFKHESSTPFSCSSCGFLR
jgi:hypothetical protein